MNHQQRRVVITGLGITSCLGNDIESFEKNLLRTKSGIHEHPSMPGVEVGWVNYEPRDYFTKKQLFTMDRVSQLAVMASKQAVQSSKLEQLDSSTTGVFYGSSYGGATTLDTSYSSYYGNKQIPRLLSVPMTMVHASAAQVSIHLGIRGECQTYSTACSSSAVAIGEGYRRIRDGYHKVAVTGGAEAMLLPGIIQEWEKLGVLVTHSQQLNGGRPFTKERKGFYLAEGAATLILEDYEHAKQRNATIFGEIVGYGVSNDAKHITKPCPIGQSRSIINALNDAAIEPREVSFINAHATGTKSGDNAESISMRKVFGSLLNTLPVIATKTLHGHSIGSVSAIEAISTILSIRKSIIPGTPYIDTIDEKCSLNLIMGRAKSITSVNYAMSNSFAFGGNNAVLIFKKYSDK